MHPLYRTHHPIHYGYELFLEESEMMQVWARLNKVAPGTLLLTVSFSAKDYQQEGNWKVLGSFETRFPWGRGEIWIQEREG